MGITKLEIWELLIEKDGVNSPHELADELDEDEKTIRTCFREMKEDGHICYNELSDWKWVIKDKERLQALPGPFGVEDKPSPLNPPEDSPPKEDKP